MCSPAGTILREDFEALALERGWSNEEIAKALTWMKDRQLQRKIDSDNEIRKREIANLKQRIADIEAGSLPFGGVR
jgi:hypothetical protein